MEDLPVGQKAWLALVEANLPIKVVLVSFEKIVMVIRYVLQPCIEKYNPLMKSVFAESCAKATERC